MSLRDTLPVSVRVLPWNWDQCPSSGGVCRSGCGAYPCVRAESMYQRALDEAWLREAAAGRTGYVVPEREYGPQEALEGPVAPMRLYRGPRNGVSSDNPWDVASTSVTISATESS